mgnify:CR=1 FL=1
MSGLGQTRRFRGVREESALPSIADLQSRRSGRGLAWPSPPKIQEFRRYVRFLECHGPSLPVDASHNVRSRLPQPPVRAALMCYGTPQQSGELNG